MQTFVVPKKKNYKSSLKFDFTFELLKDPPLFAFVTTYKNTSLKVQARNHSPTMLGPILLCHDRKTETVEKFLEKLTEKFRDIRRYIQVIGCDSEKSIINASCSTFPAAILLLCANHAKQNIKEKLRDLVSDTDLRKTVFTCLFGNESTVGLVYSNSPDEFDVRFQMLCKKLGKIPKLQNFLQYFQVHKADIFRYHLIKGIVDHSGIVDIQDLFTTNSTESINPVLKSWEN